MQTERSIGELKTALNALTKSSDQHAAKIEALSDTVHTGKGFLKAVTIVSGILGAIGVTLPGAIFKMLADHFSKH